MICWIHWREFFQKMMSVMWLENTWDFCGARRAWCDCRAVMWVKSCACQRKFRNLTSDYTESCCWRSVNQETWSRRCDTAEMWDMRIWRVGIARNAVFSIVLWLRWLRKSAPKNGSCGGSAAPDVAKICTTPARESDLEVNIVKNSRARGAFGSSSRQNLHHACARARFGNQNRKKLRARERFWKLKSPKFAPRLRFGSQNR